MTWKVVKKENVEDKEGRRYEVWELQNGTKRRATVVRKEGSVIYEIFTNFGKISNYTMERIMDVIAEYEEGGKNGHR